MSASSKCPHVDMHWNINEARLGDTNVRYLEITGRCKTCEVAVAFRGAPFGLSPAQPTMAIDGSEIRLPFLFGDDEPSGVQIGFVGRQAVP